MADNYWGCVVGQIIDMHILYRRTTWWEVVPFYRTGKLCSERFGHWPKATQREGGRTPKSLLLTTMFCISMGCQVSPCCPLRSESGDLNEKVHSIITAFLWRGLGVAGKHSCTVLPKPQLKPAVETERVQVGPTPPVLTLAESGRSWRGSSGRLGQLFLL